MGPGTATCDVPCINEAQVKVAGCRTRAIGKGPGNGSERNGRGQEVANPTIKCPSASEVMPEGEEGPVAIGTRARVKERRRTAIDLT
jgi:hypothetical protein